jgi:lysophospholipase L1-like esterase
MIKLELLLPTLLDSEQAPPLSEFGWRFLAEGDSWFSMGSLNLFTTANVLQEMVFTQRCIAINCALPGDTMQRMVDTRRDPLFTALLDGARARPWDALLISAGGNDLIDALQARGAGVPQSRRLLLRADEWGPPEQGAARYLSDAGWDTFSGYLQANFEALLAQRDRGPSRGCPVFIHGYAVPTPRPAGAGLAGPWLLPAIEAYAIPEADRSALAQLLIERLAALLSRLAADGTRLPNLHFFDSTQVPLDRAQPGTRGQSGDWLNEIHLTHAGCRKVARAWSAAIEQVLRRLQ